MTAMLALSSATVAIVVVVALPALIIGVGELEERLRQRDSNYGTAVSIVRVWALPLLATRILIRTLFDLDQDNVWLRMLDSALLLALATATLSALRVFVASLADRPRRTGRRAVPRLLLAVPRLLVILGVAWVLIAGVWGVDLSSLLTALGVTSLVISFALQDTLGGIASGFTLLADQPFGPGDWIESGDVEGRVIDVNWRSTRIQNRNGDLVVIPNGQLSKATIVNFDQPSRHHRVMVPVQIERTASPTAAKAMLLDAARSTDGVLLEPAPVVFVTNIADPVVDYQTFMWVDDYSIVPRVRADFASLVWYLSYRHGVPLPNPAQDLYLFDGAKSALEREIPPADVRYALLQAHVLAEMSDEVIDRLAESAVIESYQQGEIITATDRPRDLIVLDQGRAHLTLSGRGVSDLHVLDFSPGELFGMANDMPDDDLRGRVVALTDCRVVRVPVDDARAALAGASGLGGALDQLAASRRRRCERAVRRVVRDGAVPTLDGVETASDGDGHP